MPVETFWHEIYADHDDMQMTPDTILPILRPAKPFIECSRYQRKLEPRYIKQPKLVV
ncbi:hypothetical protein GCM10007874_50840 [Labrys miyagiensis]|uniref:Uncharacterized protein n=1 Tax=Labrys miyagiensis TaxID=346912 RepID=A0ABQ6CNV9_9HYPH|nr:hypothetical protein GCM10007874_50840 [Labrys miyagiensis]